MMHGQRNFKLNQQTVYGIEVAFCIWPIDWSSGLVFRYCYWNNDLYCCRGWSFAEFFYYLFRRVYNPCFTGWYSTGYLQDLFLYKCLYVCLFVQLSLFPLRCILRLSSGYGWSLSDCCRSMLWMLLIRLDTALVFMWCCIIWGSVSVWNVAGLTLVNRLQSFRRWRAVCSSISGQLHSGEDVFVLLWR